MPWANRSQSQCSAANLDGEMCAFEMDAFRRGYAVVVNLDGISREPKELEGDESESDERRAVLK